MNERSRGALPWLLAAACLVYDPAALAADSKRSIGLLLAALGLAWLLFRRLQPPALHPAQRCLLGCVAWLGLSALFGAPGRWLVLGNWCLLAALAASLTSLAPVGLLGPLGARAVACRTALLVAAATSLWLIGAWLLAQRGMQLHAGQGNPNWAGLVLAIAWPLALADPLFERASRLLSTVFGLAFATALVLSESRVGWIASALALITAVGVASSRRERLACALQLAALLACISLSIALPTARTVSAPAPPQVVAPTQPNLAKPVHRKPELDRSALTSFRGRLWIQRVAFDVALQHLPFGSGLGGFFPAFLEEQGHHLALLAPAEANRKFSNATTAHNDWIELLAEAGPIAPLFLLGALALAFRAWARTREHAFCGALVSVSVAGLADSPFHLPAVCILLALAFAALPPTAPRASAEAPAPPTEAPPRFAGSTPWLFLALLLACAFLFSRSLAAWLSTRVASAALLRPPSERRALLERAAHLAPDSSERALDLGLARRDNDDLPGAVRALERATRLGGDLASYVALGAAYLEASEFTRARDAFEEALARSPGSVRAHSGLSEALRCLGQLDSAESHAAIASALLPGDPDLRARLDAIREQKIDRALDLNPAPVSP